PAEDTASLIADLQQGLGPADLPLAETAQKALTVARNGLERRIKDIFSQVDGTAHELIYARLNRGRVESLREAQRYFRFTSESAAKYALSSSATRSWAVAGDRDDVRELRSRLTRLRPAAERANAKLDELKKAEAT